MAIEKIDKFAQDEILKDEYSRVVEPVGDDTYIAYAVPGSELTDAVWQVQYIDSDGTRKWADGNTLFDNVATSPLSGLTFDY